MDLALLERKRILKEVLITNDKIVYCNHIENEGKALSKLVKDQDYEGILQRKRTASTSRIP
jgi:hypothetical protein